MRSIIYALCLTLGMAACSAEEDCEDCNKGPCAAGCVEMPCTSDFGGGPFPYEPDVTQWLQLYRVCDEAPYPEGDFECGVLLQAYRDPAGRLWRTVFQSQPHVLRTSEITYEGTSQRVLGISVVTENTELSLVVTLSITMLYVGDAMVQWRARTRYTGPSPPFADDPWYADGQDTREATTLRWHEDGRAQSEVHTAGASDRLIRGSWYEYDALSQRPSVTRTRFALRDGGEVGPGCRELDERIGECEAIAIYEGDVIVAFTEYGQTIAVSDDCCPRGCIPQT